MKGEINVLFTWHVHRDNQAEAYIQASNNKISL